MSETQGKPTPTVMLEFGDVVHPSSREMRPAMIRAVLHMVGLGWLFWRCGWWLAALFCFAFGLLCAAMFALSAETRRWMGPFAWSDVVRRAELSDGGVTLVLARGPWERFAWSDVVRLQLPTMTGPMLHLRDRKVILMCASFRSRRLIAALRDYGSPPKLVDIPGFPPRSCDVLADLEGLRVAGPEPHAWALGRQPISKELTRLIGGVVVAVCLLSGWRWEAALIASMLWSLPLMLLQVLLIPNSSVCVDWSVKDGLLHIRKDRRSTVVRACDIVKVAPMARGCYLVAFGPLRPRRGAEVWTVATLRGDFELVVRDDPGRRLLAALRKAAWVTEDERPIATP